MVKTATLVPISSPIALRYHRGGVGPLTSAKITHAAAIAYFFWISTSYPAARWYAERMRCSSPAVAPTVMRLVGGICAAGAGAGAGAGMPGVERCAGGGGGGGATGVAV